MSDKVIAIEELEGPFQFVFRRVMQMIPDRDKDDKNLQRLIAFRLRQDGEAATREYIIRKVREVIQCGYTGGFYNYLKDDQERKACQQPPFEPDTDPPVVA